MTNNAAVFDLSLGQSDVLQEETVLVSVRFGPRRSSTL